MSLGGNIKRIRTDKNIGIDSFAAKLGLPVEACLAIEDDNRSLSSVEIQTICQILGVTFDSLVYEKKSSLENLEINDVEENDAAEESVLMPVDELQKLLGKMNDEQ